MTPKMAPKQKSQLNVSSNFEALNYQKQSKQIIRYHKKDRILQCDRQNVFVDLRAARATDRQMCQSLHNHNGG